LAILLARHDPQVAPADWRGRRRRALLSSNQLAVQPNRQDVLAGPILAIVLAGYWRAAGLAKVGAVTAGAGDDVVAVRFGLRGHPEYLFAGAIAPAEPLIGLGGDLNGADGSGIVGADGEGHVATRPVYHVRSQLQYRYRTTTGRDPGNGKLPCTNVDAPPPVPLASIRKRKLLSQRALAARAGVALSTVYLLEAGKTERATFKVMRAVSDALEVPPESIAEFRRVLDAG
jgi:DNA-binding Xre family transcriptional regulator